jgi:hypothetical protein
MIWNWIVAETQNENSFLMKEPFSRLGGVAERI